MKTKILVSFIALSLLISFSFVQAQVTTASAEPDLFAQTIRQQIEDIKEKIAQLQKQLEEMIAESGTGKIQKKTVTKTINVAVSDPVVETREGYDLPIIDDYDFMQNPSAPNLPVKSFSLAIPREAKIKNIKMVSSKKEVLRGEFNVFPAQQPVPLSETNKDDSPDFTPPNPSIYKSSNMYPGKVIEYAGEGYLRDYHILNINVYPLQYNPSGKKLTFYKNIDIEVSYTVLVSKSDKKTGKQDEFTEMVKGMVDNPEDVDELSIMAAETASDVLQQDDVEYLIITKEFLESEFQVLLDWKFDKGLTGKIVTLSWIKENYTGTDTQEQIRNFLKDARTAWNTKWVLLGGDTNVVPHRLIYSQYNPMGMDYGYNVNLPADIYYSGLDENTINARADLYPDVFVGRAPVDSIGEVKTFVNKVIGYEKGPAGYETTALFMADDSGSAYTGKLIKRKLLPKHFSLTELSETSATAGMRELNIGYGIVNHVGHSWKEGLCLASGCGQYNRIKSTNVNTLTNSARYPIYYGAGCLSNAMDWIPHTVAESFILNPNGGAVAYIGNSRYGIAIPSDPGNGPSDNYNKSFYNSLFNKGIDNLGEAFADSKAALASSCIQPWESPYRYLQYGLNLLGDPEMKIWTSKNSVPSKLSVTTTSPAKVNKGSVFTIDATISYYGEATATGVETVLTLPSGLSASESLTDPINDMLPGHSAKVSWNVNANTTGIYNITITASAANVSSASNTTTVQVITPDSTPPTITLHSPGNNATVGDDKNVVFKYTPSDDSGISKCELMVNGSMLSTDYKIENGAVNEFSALITAGTNHEWKVNCIDDSPDANKGYSEQRTLIVNDLTSPENGSIDIVDNSGYTNDVEPDLRISAIGADYMAFSCNNVSFSGWITYTSEYSSFNMETGAGCVPRDGSKIIYAKFKDKTNNEGALSSDTTILDTIAPVISDVSSLDIFNTTAVINWTTNEESDSVVNYGTTIGLGLTASDGTGTNHSVKLTNLLPETTYYYEAQSTDLAGNVAVGGCYAFTTALSKYMHVESIDMSKTDKKSKGRQTYATAIVTIVDVGDNPVGTANVSGSWIHPNGGYQHRSIVTDSSGQATTNSWSVKNARGTFTFTVDNVTKIGYVYDSSANEVTSKSITVK